MASRHRHRHRHQYYPGSGREDDVVDDDCSDADEGNNDDEDDDEMSREEKERRSQWLVSGGRDGPRGLVGVDGLQASRPGPGETTMAVLQ